MISVTPQMRVLVAVEPADFRCGIDGLARRCREALAGDPFSGALFVFRNRNRKAIKIQLVDKVVEQALGGDLQALKLCLDRVVPSYRSQTPPGPI